MHACQRTLDRRGAVRHFAIIFTTNPHKPKHSNLQEVVSMLGDDVCGNFIKNNIGPSRVSFRVISTHLDGCWLFFVGVGICWPRTIANFNITLFRSRAGVQPKDTFWVFSPVRFLIHTRTGLSPIQPEKKNCTVLTSTNVHPYRIHKQTTFWTLRSRVLQL